MLTAQFNAIVAFIERDLGGAGYFVRLRLIDGSTVFGALAPLKGGEYGNRVYAVRIERAAEESERESNPDLFVPLGSIVAIEGPMMEWQPS